ncbi:MAG: hypothetical protein A3E36_03305 [Candidatus Andersenbacteria bacterium RIFCSPHIGHO2_12_FULL_45_11b]|uniref:Uncharacterized protein n=1 Tax=Candidatus Andersenbacteria bacterium RIFCSPHIGHO2_12_FULL_45_11b TaxID=1797282 RepID=A0A1G1X9P2_9BACT|nr:MAG: hypothetical protein A3E36_03305 [Candidatus Andersenbacteria bacterium RIFCSPHIGHO2_12_FULL_45_11b]
MITDWRSNVVRTIVIRTRKKERSGTYYVRAFEKQGIRIGKIVRTLLEDISLPAVDRAVQTSLIAASNADLDCPSCYTLQTTLAMGHGIARLEYCSLEEVLQFRLEYTDQPMGERFIVAMNPVLKNDNQSHLLSVECNERGLWLYSYTYDLKTVRNKLNQFLWKLPASSL